MTEQLAFVLQREQQLATKKPGSWKKAAEEFGTSPSNARCLYAKKELIKEYAALGLGYKKFLTEAELKKFKNLRATLSDKDYNDVLINDQKRQRMKQASHLRAMERDLQKKEKELPATAKKLLKEWDEQKKQPKKWTCEVNLDEFPTLPGNINVTVKALSRQFTVDGLSVKSGISENGFKFRSETRWKKSFSIPINVDMDRGPVIRKKHASSSITVTYDIKEEGFKTIDGKQGDIVSAKKVAEDFQARKKEGPQRKKELVKSTGALTDQFSSDSKKKNNPRIILKRDEFEPINVAELSSSEDESNTQDDFFTHNSPSTSTV